MPQICQTHPLVHVNVSVTRCYCPRIQEGCQDAQKLRRLEVYHFCNVFKHTVRAMRSSLQLRALAIQKNFALHPLARLTVINDDFTWDQSFQNVLNCARKDLGGNTVITTQIYTIIPELKKTQWREKKKKAEARMTVYILKRKRIKTCKTAALTTVSSTGFLFPDISCRCRQEMLKGSCLPALVQSL